MTVNLLSLPFTTIKKAGEVFTGPVEMLFIQFCILLMCGALPGFVEGSF